MIEINEGIFQRAQLKSLDPDNTSILRNTTDLIKEVRNLARKIEVKQSKENELFLDQESILKRILLAEMVLLLVLESNDLIQQLKWLHLGLDHIKLS